MQSVLQYVLYVAILVALAIPLGRYIGKVMNGERVFMSKIGTPCERFIYRIMRIDPNEHVRKKIYFERCAF